VSAAASTPLLAASGIDVRFGDLHAVRDVSLEIPAGPFGLGLIGESGSGKSTIARALLGLTPLDGGTVSFEGRDVRGLKRAELKAYRRSVQFVMQDGTEALDPRMRIGASVAEGLAVHELVPRGAARAGRVAELLVEVGLDAALADRYPHELSGGQRQRATIARALAVEPRVLVLDEPTSALDVTVQARILALIKRLRDERSLSYLLISHNLAVVDQLCEQCIVLRDGEVVERGATAQVLDDPHHPYTQELRATVPEIPAPAAVRRPEPPS
jgi:ABC-type microcin C transport system duplicated ATPase subunit YejF